MVGQERGVDRFVSLPVRLGADIEADGAVLLEDDAGILGRIAQDGFDVVADTLAPDLAFRLGCLAACGETRDVGLGHDAVHNPVEVTDVVGVGNGRLVGELRGRNEALAAKLPWIDAQLARRVVHRAFQREDRLGPAGTAIGIDLRGRGEDAPAFQIDLLNVVDAHRDLGEEIGLDRLGIVRVVGPDIADRVGAIGDQPVIGIEGQFRLGDQVAPTVVGEHRLGPLRHPAHRATQRPRSSGHGEVLGIRHALHAKAATHVRVGHADIRLVEAKASGQVALKAPDTLSAEGEMKALAVPFGETAARLH